MIHIVSDNTPQKVLKNNTSARINRTLELMATILKNVMPENPDYPAIKVTEENELIIWGVVTYVVKQV